MILNAVIYLVNVSIRVQAGKTKLSFCAPRYQFTDGIYDTAKAPTGQQLKLEIAS